MGPQSGHLWSLKIKKNVRVEFDINFVTLSSKQAFSIIICTIVFKRKVEKCLGQKVVHQCRLIVYKPGHLQQIGTCQNHYL